MVDFRIRVVVDPRNAEVGNRRVQRSLARTNEAANRLRNTLLRTFAFVGLTAALTGSVRLLASFEQELATVRGVTQATDAQFAALTERAKELGATTRFSATQAAEGLTFLARAGFNAEQAIDTIGDTLRLAQAGALGLGRAADIASNVLKGFGLEVDQAERVVDVLAATATSSNTTIESLGQALSFAAPIAASLGIEIESAAAAIGALGDAGIPATRAGRGLNAVLAVLESGNENLAKAAERSGQTLRDFQPSAVGLERALKNLQNANIGASEGFEIFGRIANPAFQVLSSGADDVDRLSVALQSAEGSAERLAAIMDDNLNGALLSVRSALEAVILEFGQAGPGGVLENALRSIADGLRFLARNIDIVINAVETLAVVIATRLVGRAFHALAIAVATNPLGLFLTALGLVTAAVIGFADQITIASDSATTLQDTFVAAFEVIRQFLFQLVDSFRFFSDDVEDEGQKAADGFNLSFREVALGAARVFDNILGLFLGLGAALRQTGALIVGTLVNVLNGFLNFVETSVDGVLAVGRTIGRFFSRLIFGLTSSFRAFAASASAALSGNFEAAGELGEQAVDQLRNNLKGAFTNIGKEFENSFKLFANERLVPEVENAFKDAADAGVGGILDAFTERFRDSNVLQTLAENVFGVADDTAALRAAREAQAERDRAARDRSRAGAGGGGTPAGGPGGERPDGSPGTNGFQKVLQDLEKEVKLIEMVGLTRGAAAEVNRIAIDLAKERIKLAPEERERLQTQIEANNLLRAQAEVLEEIRGPQENFQLRIEAINELFESGKISVGEYNQALRDTRLAALQADQTISGGFERGLIRIQNKIEDLGSVSEQVLVNAFNNIEDALVNFVRTGEFEFEQFVNQLLDDITRLLIRLLILQAVQAATGTGGATTAIGAVERQRGGPVQGNQPFLVGEAGPELFVPSGQGMIVPNDQTAALAATQAPAMPVVTVPPPEVNVNVVNVTDPNEIGAALDSGDNDRQVLNVLRRNPNVVKRLSQ